MLQKGHMQFKNLTPIATIFACALFLAACQLPPNLSKDTSEKTTQEQSQVAPTTKELSVKTSYTNPGGSDEVGFTLVVDSTGVITDAKTETLATNPTSLIRQQSFASELPTVLKGKKLSELSQIDKVGGSSLTTAAFNKSLDQLKAQL